MACFLVPMAVGIILWVIQRTEGGKAWAERWGISWLNTLIWGGCLLLAFEHIAHGEIVLWPPFLTAMQTPAEIPVMLHEMATFGTAMTITLSATWGAMYSAMRNVLGIKPTELTFRGLTRKTE